MLSPKRREIVSSLALILVGAFFAFGSMKYGDLRGGVPSAGLFPCLGGIILIFLSSLHLFISVKKEESHGTILFFPRHDSQKKITLVLSSLLAYALILQYAGFLITNLAFMIFLLRYIEPQKWSRTLATSFSVSIISYITFEILLKVQLPYGIFNLSKILKEILK